MTVMGAFDVLQLFLLFLSLGEVHISLFIWMVVKIMVPFWVP